MRIAIIGGGITGLTTALSLHKMGLSCTIFEKAPQLQEIGAGIWLQPNAIEVLEWLGIRQKVEESGIRLTKMEITNRNLQPIRPIEEKMITNKNGYQTIAIHRGVLQQLLYNEVRKHQDVQLDAPYQSHDDHGSAVQVKIGNHTHEVDLLLAADGIHSLVRNKVFPTSSLRNSKQVCWRGIADHTLPKALQHQGRELWGKQVRFGFSPISKEAVYWFAVANEQNYGEVDDLASIKGIYRNFHPIVQELLTQTPTIHKATLYDLKRLPNWHQGRICLLGDAAHATTPNMGQGACQGMEDAYYLSQALAKQQDPATAFNTFTNNRRKKVDYVVNNSWRFGKMAHHPVGQAVMKMIMKATPARVMQKQMQQLYHLSKS